MSSTKNIFEKKWLWCVFMLFLATFLVAVVVLLLYLDDGVRCDFEEEDDVEESLKLVHIIFRHGERTPDLKDVYPKDPYINHTYYPYGYGQLTNYGKQREFKLGKELFKRYHKLLGATYINEYIKAISSDYDRTKMSLSLVLAALYPPKGNYAWDKEYPWQPIPYDFLPYNQDKMFLGGCNCPNLIPKLMEVYKLKEVQEIMKEYIEDEKKISEITGLDLVNKPYQAWNLYLTLDGQRQLGMPLSDSIKEFYPNPLKEMAINQYKFLTYNEDLKKIVSGYLLEYILTNTITKVNNKNDRKIYLYAGHEVTIAGLLRTLEIYEPNFPTYGSYIAFELHELEDVYGVKIFYQDHSTDKPKQMVLPGCDSLCTLNQFSEFLTKYIPKDEDCGL